MDAKRTWVWTTLITLLWAQLAVASNTTNSQQLTKKRSVFKTFRNWQKVKIPGAYCGNGTPYAVWIDRRSDEKLAIEFMGGGACWSAKTCFGKKLRAWILPIPRLPLISSFQVRHPKWSPIHNHSMIYFPYCTGDVHAGKHVAHYNRNVQVFHYGYKNIELAFEYLNRKELIDFKNYDEIVMYGSSAGAIGATLHTQTLKDYINPAARKFLLADAPGMHWGNTFWNKFTDDINNDFIESFSKLGFKYSLEDGNVAKYLPQICSTLHDWNIGLLQGSMDAVMSAMFGNISPLDHRGLVYGERGLLANAPKTNNCSVWLPDTPQHTFLIFPYSIIMKAEGTTALDFARAILKGKRNLVLKK
jgi:hypothetical protein